MTTRGRYKTFPDQPAWNSGAALGSLAGVMGFFVMPNAIFKHASLLEAVAASVVSGILAGALFGFIVSKSRRASSAKFQDH